MIGAASDAMWRYVGAASQPAFQNSWANSGAPHANTRFRKTAHDIVYIQMAVGSGSAAAVFTLPVGYRPSAQIDVPGLSNGQQVATVSSAGVVSVPTTGLGAPCVFNFSFPVDQ